MHTQYFLFLFSLAVLACSPAQQPLGHAIDAPGELSAELTGPSSAVLHWKDNVAELEGHYVFLREGDGYYIQPLARTEAGADSYAFDKLKAGATYFLGVQAIGKGDNVLSRIVYAPALTVPIPQDPDEVPVLTALDAGYACLVARYSVKKFRADEPENGLCWREGTEDPTVEDSILEGPELNPGTETLQLVPAAVLEAGKTYRVRTYLRYSDKVLYSEAQTVTLPEQPAAIRMDWKKLASPYAGIDIYETSTPLNGRKFHAWYAVADCTGDVEFRVLNPETRMTLEQQSAAAGDCLVLINGGIYGTKHIGVIIADGKPQAWRDEVDGSYWGYDSKLYPVTRGVFGVDRSGHPLAGWTSAPSDGHIYFYSQPLPTVMGEALYPLTSASFPAPALNWEPWQAISTGPLVLHEGRVTVDREKTARGYYRTNYECWAEDIFPTRPDRTLVGCMADGRIVLFICDGRIATESEGAYLDEAALILKGIGCTEALNLDGGGSTAMVVGGKRLNSQAEDGKEPYNRAVLSSLGFFRNR